MHLEEEINKAVETAKEEAKQRILSYHQGEAEKKILNVIDLVYATGNYILIEELDKRFTILETYVKESLETKTQPREEIFGVHKETPKEKKERLKVARKQLKNTLEGYSSSLVSKIELSTKTGLTIHQLDGYTRGGDPLFIKGSDGNYEILKKNF